MPAFPDWNVFYPERLNVHGGAVDICVYKTGNHKCPRCWMYTSNEENQLCKRCLDIVVELLVEDEPEKTLSAKESKDHRDVIEPPLQTR